MRAAVYYRMSKDDQTDSPERQRLQVEPYCRKQGYRIVQTYHDHGMRGWDDTRPDFNRLLKDAKEGKFDVVVVDEMSRLSRNDPMDYIAMVAHPLKEANVSLDSVAEGRQDPEELGGIILTTVRQHAASKESATLGRRTATGLFRLATQQGAFVGRAPYGYRDVRSPEKRGRVGYELGDDAQVAVVRRIFDEYVNRDLSIRAIVERLNSEGVTPPGKAKAWGASTVHQILTNPAYAGDLVFGRIGRGRFARVSASGTAPVKKNQAADRRTLDECIIKRDVIPAIVSRDQFEEVQRLRKLNQKRCTSSRKMHEYPFSQMLRCACCGETMHGTSYKESPLYRCGASMMRNACGARTVHERVILEEVLRVLREKFLQPENIERLRTAVREEFELSRKAAGGQRDSWRRTVDQLDAKIRKAEKNLAEIDPEFIKGLQEQIRAWRTERERAATELSKAQETDPSERFDDVVSGVERLVSEAENADSDQLRILVRSAIDHIDIQTDTIQCAKYRKYPLRGGVIVLKGSAHESEVLSENCRDHKQRSGRTG